MRMQTKSTRRHASGNALLIAVVLLLLAGVMTVLAMNVGIFEQRSTANDVRAKAVHEVAEAGLAQGAEFLLRQNPAMLAFPTGTGTWTQCAANDDTFPCGSIPVLPGTGSLVDADGDPATSATVQRRATMYRLTNSGASIANLDAALVSRMLNIPAAAKIASVGSGFDVAYGVAPLMCFVANRHVDEAANSPIRCATAAEDTSERRIATFVSVASIVGENARTTLTQTVGRYPLLAAPTGKPPIIASGSVDITGTLQIVTNPNAGGTGVPVSVWTRKDIDKTGTPNTCYADEFFRFGAKNNDPPDYGDDDGLAGFNTIKAIICDTCQCIGNESLSYDSSGGVQDEGIDILDVDAGTTSADRGTGVNYNVRSDSLSFPLCEFPPDLFAHLFGVRAWDDVDEDCFAEVKIMREFTNPNTGAVVTIGADEAFLYENAVSIINATTAGAALRSPTQAYAGAYPASTLSGLIWCQANCDIGSNTQLGTPDNPVVLVADGDVRIQGRVFGIVFLRTTAGGATNTPAGGYTMTSAEIGTGGGATLRMNAGSAVYGSLVVQGQVEKANGTAAVIYSEAVLNAIGQNPNNNRFGTLPGAWNDRSTY
jgi:Tfp pilus assembly protein PilX